MKNQEYLTDRLVNCDLILKQNKSAKSVQCKIFKEKKNHLIESEMLIHNKRLHPRRPCDAGEHFHGCMLHDMQEQSSSVRNSKSPNRSRTPTSPSRSSSVLSQRRQRNQSTSSSNSGLYSPRTSTPQPSQWSTSTYNKRYSLGTFPNTYDQINSIFGDTVDSPSKPSLKLSATSSVSKSDTKQKSKSTICLNSSVITGTETDKPEKRTNTVTFKCYDSPEEIIANLFPGIDDIQEPKYLRKGHGAAQMAKNRSSTHAKNWSNVGRSSSATGNYVSSTVPSDHRSQTFVCGRSHSVERDFSHFGCVIVYTNECDILNVLHCVHCILRQTL